MASSSDVGVNQVPSTEKSDSHGHSYCSSDEEQIGSKLFLDNDDIPGVKFVVLDISLHSIEQCSPSEHPTKLTSCCHGATAHHRKFDGNCAAGEGLNRKNCEEDCAAIETDLVAR
ncbi:hypothetical protein OROGR_023624 [Orobanche gracilis]